MKKPIDAQPVSPVINMSSIVLAISVVIGTSIAIASSDARAHKARISASDENFAAIETNCQMLYTQKKVGGVNLFDHHQQMPSSGKPTYGLNSQGIYYSKAVVNVSEGATLFLPDSSARLSVQVITEDNRLQPIHYGSGIIDLNSDLGRFVYVIVRLEADIDEITALSLQQQMEIHAGSDAPYILRTPDNKVPTSIASQF